MFGVLKHYDLPDLAAAADTDSLLLLNPLDSLWRPEDAQKAEAESNFTAAVRFLVKACERGGPCRADDHCPLTIVFSHCISLPCRLFVS